MNKDAHLFVKKKAIKYSKKQFLIILEYMVFCYYRLAVDNQEKQRYYSISNHKHKDIKFEDWLKIRFVEDYLQQFQYLFPSLSIKNVRFEYETGKVYRDSNDNAHVAKIDIIISNLGLQEYWSTVKKEELYFVFECKRLKNTSHNADYILDIQKFVERHYRFRFPFEGMIGFVEKSSLSIDAIIDDINKRLRTHSTIKTVQELTPFPIYRDFQYCRLSKHEKLSSERIPIEVYHLFLDYSKLIIR